MKFMRRDWVKLWVNEWLDGTTRFQMSGAQRAFWIDLLAMAGRSRYPGVVCAGRDGEQCVGYPLKTLAALDAGEEIDIFATLDLFSKTGKIKVEITAEDPVRLYKITICNWDRYQSEYQRQKRYRGTRPKVTAEVTLKAGAKLPVEEEAEGESEGKGEKEERQEKSSATASDVITEAFAALGHKPFGPRKFQEIWGEEWSATGEDHNWTDIMERAIQRCQSLKAKVTGLFYKHKREIENGDVKMRYKFTPL